MALPTDKICPSCRKSNHISAVKCTCGHAFTTQFQQAAPIGATQGFTRAAPTAPTAPTPAFLLPFIDVFQCSQFMIGRILYTAAWLTAIAIEILAATVMIELIQASSNAGTMSGITVTFAIGVWLLGTMLAVVAAIAAELLRWTMTNAATLAQISSR